MRRRQDTDLVGVSRPPQTSGTGGGVPVDMRCACGHLVHMSKMIQIRNVPDAVHRTIKARAAQSGMTLSDYLLVEIERIAALPTRDEMLARRTATAPTEGRRSLRPSASEPLPNDC